MTPLQKVAIFLMMIGREKGQSILALMDTGEIKAVVPAIRKLEAVSAKLQESIWTELAELGYEEGMNPSEALTVIRFLFDGRKIGAGSER